jgi:hypothetical protein
MNKIPYDAEWLKAQISATENIDLQILEDSGFIVSEQGRSETLATRKQSATLERETEERQRRVEKKEVVALSATTDPVKEAVSDWNLLADRLNLPKVERLSPARRKKWLANYGNGSADRWDRVLVAVGLSGFCQGENDRGWKADFDFVVTTSKIDKLLEGSYDGQKPESALRQAARNVAREINSDAGDTGGGHPHSELGHQGVGVETEDVPGDFTVLGRGDLGDGN